jgi:hypothetical protein
MAVRKDEIQIGIEIQATEGVKAFQKLLDPAKQLNNAMARLKKQGKENTEEYKKLERQAAKLNKEFAAFDIAVASKGQLIARSKMLNREMNGLVKGTKRYVDSSNELKRINSRLAEIRQDQKGVAQGMDEIRIAGIKIPSVIAKIGGAFIGISILDKVKEIGIGLFNLGTELQLFGKKAETVFGEYIGNVQELAAQNAESMGLTKGQYVDASAAIADLLVPMGFQRDESAKLSTDLVNLSGALSQWSGGQRDATEVSNILSKAMLGEREELKSLGIAISEEDVKNRLREKGLEGLTGQYLQQAKAIATMELIMEKSTDAQTAFIQNTDENIDKQALLRARFGEIREEVATRLIPFFGRLLDIGIKVLDWGVRFAMTLASIPKFIKENKVEIGALIVALIAMNAQQIVAAASALRVAAAQKASVIATRSMAVAQQALNLIMRANPIGLVVSAIALLVIGLQQAYKRSEVFRATIKGLGAVAVEFFNILKESLSAFVSAWESFKEGRIKDGLKQIGEGLRKGNPVAAAFTEGKRLKQAFVDGYEESRIEDNAKKEAENLRKGVEALKPEANSAGKELGDEILQGINDRLKDGPVSAEGAEGAAQGLAKIKAERSKDNAILQPLQSLNNNGVSEVESTGEAAVDTTAQEDRLKNKFLKALITEQEYEDRRFQLQQEAYDKRLDYLRQKHGEESAAFVSLENEKLNHQQDYEEQRAEMTKKTEDARKAMLQDGLGALNDVIDETLKFLGKEEAARKKNALAAKAFAIGKIVVDTEQAISAIIKHAQDNASNILFPGAGNLIAGIKIAAVTAKSVSSISKVRNQSFYGGGYTGASVIIPDQHGGIVGGVHKDEWVAPAWMTKDDRYGGIINWLEGVRQRGYKDGGFAGIETSAAASAASAPSPILNTQRLESMMVEVRDSNMEVARAIKAKQFNVTSGQVVDALNEENRLDRNSSF